MAHATHQPGVCNIGPAEIRVRRMTAWVGFVLAVAFFIILRSIKASQAFYALEFFPVLLFTNGWVQTRSRFCIYFGIKGIFNFGGLMKFSSRESIDDAAFRAADRATALKLLGRSLALALPITMILILIS
jgi:hypothetical protein